MTVLHLSLGSLIVIYICMSPSGKFPSDLCGMCSEPYNKKKHLVTALPLNVRIIIHLLKKFFLLKIIIKYEPKNWILCYFSILRFVGGDGSMCRIGDTGHLGLCTWNFEFWKNISISLFFVSIFHNRKAKLKQIGYMKQHCWKETTLKSWVITKSDFYELLPVCVEIIGFYPINIVFLWMPAMQRRTSMLL